MQIKGIGTLAVAGEMRGSVEFNLVFSEGFAAGRGEISGDAGMLAAAFRADRAALHHPEWGDPLDIMLVGAPEGSVADFVPVLESPRYWAE
jgi:hypothetical protein